MNDPPKLYKIGLTQSRDDFPKEVVRAHELRLSQAATLRDLAVHYRFYTPALLHLHVRLLDRDPFVNFCQETGRQVVPLSIRFDKPVFRGLETADGDAGWNHTLFAMEHADFEAYAGWMGTLAFTDRDRNLVSRVCLENLWIADPLALAKLAVLPRKLPTVGVTAFWLDTNRGCHFLQSDGDSVLDPPWAVHSDVIRPDTLIWARAILYHHPDPYGHVEATLAPDQPLREIQERVAEARRQPKESIP